jgi:signal transduction histidine kinase
MSKISIKSKLVRMQLTLAFLILLTAAMAFTLNDLFIFKRSVERSLEAMARVLSQNLAPTLAFSDQNEATKILSSLQSEPSISSAYLLDNQSQTFAKYGGGREQAQPNDKMPGFERSHLRGSHLVFYYAIMQESELKGTLYLEADLWAFAAEYKSYMWVLTSVLLVGLLMSFGLAHLIQRSLSRPIKTLAETAKAISSSGNYSLRMSPEIANDHIAEISLLSTQFNQMLDQIEAKDEKILAANSELEKKVELRTLELKEIQKTALQNAHAAGMAEIATGILHNIGNIVNSVNTSVEEIGDIMQKSKLAGFIRANEMLKVNIHRAGEFLTLDPKGKLLPEYYLKIGETLQEEHTHLKNESAALTKKMALIKDVIQTQQEYAKKDLFFEELSLSQITEEILELQMNSLHRHEITIVKSYQPARPVRVQRVKFAHILMNLVKNAKEAMAHQPSGHRKLHIEIEEQHSAGVILRITDSGDGIDPKNLEKIFNHGFTTKQSGHGFGLHFCANAMTEMGGKMVVESKGAGHGATFVLYFSAGPLKEVKHA